MLRLARAMREAETVLILADDPIAPAEIAAAAEANGWTVRAEAEGFLVTSSATA